MFVVDLPSEGVAFHSSRDCLICCLILALRTVHSRRPVNVE